jgi:ribA/ribD-fused uncharacterized protein
MTIRDRAALTAFVAAGGQPKYMFFWGHQPERDGRVGAGCLSQWWPADFTINDLSYATAEHYMMWRKATLFGDDAAAAEILTAAHPQIAKSLGRGVRDFDEATWVASRFEIVVEASVAKFGQNADLGDFLLRTGDRVLVEASPRDQIWGIGLGAKNDRATDPAQWRGRNLLGFALMEARSRLRS